MIFIYKDKNIKKWQFWRGKPKVLFCLANGFLYSMFMIIGGFLFRWLLLSDNAKSAFVDSLSVGDGFFIGGGFYESHFLVWK